jgi:hypothetical protein
MESSLRQWLLEESLPQLPSRRGLGSVHLFEAALTPAMTAEQRIRGADAGVDWALFATGYGEEDLASLLGWPELRAHGATGIVDAMYQLDYSLAKPELGAPVPRPQGKVNR